MEGVSEVRATDEYLHDYTRKTAGTSDGREEKVKAVLLVGKCVLRETGNATTLDRLGRAVKACGWECVTRDPDRLPDGPACHALITQHNIIAVVGIHAYRSAPVLLTCQDLGVPYVLMFGGTDINECVREAAKRDVMGRVVAGARSLTAFHASARDTALQIWPSIHRDKVWILPQAVQVSPDPDFDVLSFLESIEEAHVSRTFKEEQVARKTYVSNSDAKVESIPLRERKKIVTEGYNVKEKEYFRENELSEESEGVSAQRLDSEALTNGIPRKLLKDLLLGTLEPLPDIFQPLVLLVAGLRPVKDVLYLTEAWSEWQKARGGCGRFLILGPALDPQYTAHVHAQMNRLSGVRVCPTLSPAECQALIRNATLLVNSSWSESMSSAILEAMALGTPVLARDIPGNSCVITHGQTGLLYSSPDAFLQGLDDLLRDSVLRRGLVTAAKNHVARFHSLQQEKNLLLRILKQAMQ